MKKITLPDDCSQERIDMLLRKHLNFPAGELKKRDATPEELRSLSKRLVAGARRMFDDANGEKREMSDDEQIVFDYALSLADWQKEMADSGGVGARVGNISRIDGDANQDRARRSNSRRPALTFVDSHGNEVRALAKDESIASAIKYDLPDGIRPEELSIGRLVRAYVTGDWSKAQAEKRAMGGSSNILGGYLVPAPLSANVIDIARNQARIFQAGAQTLPMVNSNSLTLAKVLTDAGTSWKLENQPAAFQDMTFGAITLIAKTLVSLATMSVEVIEDAANLDSVVTNAMGAVMALELDRACLRGDGSAASPVGIRNTPNIQTVDLGANGAALSATAGYSFWSQAVQKVQEKNGEPNATIFAPRTAGVLDRLLDGMNNPQRPPESFQELEQLVTNQVPVNLTKGTSNVASESYVADFTELLVGIRTDLTFEMTRLAGDSSGSAFRNLQVWIRTYLRADVALMRPEHFVLIDGIL
jgi:HK97 family phage major capsid protein